MRSFQWAGGLLCVLTLAAQGEAGLQRSVLPISDGPFRGQISELARDSTPDPHTPVVAPRASPNVFLMMSDDVGFAMASVFGGPVPTLNFERLAQQGVRYNRFHTTGICSPTRASLLTGRNHHNAGAGYLTDVATGYPGYNGRISNETATLAQVLRLNGYNTAMFGKHHNVPPGEETANGPFDRWPTGLGFEYFFGYIGPESDQFRTNIYRGTDLLPGDDGMRLLDARMADDAIRWLHNQQATASGKPFFIYFSPSSTHEPHQAPETLIARFKGRFDQGWDTLREEIFQRQLSQGIVPANTRLTPRPESIPAWDSLTPGQQAFAARSMEVAAAMLAYQDEQVGRVLVEMERMGVMSNTLVAIIIGDNGASADQGVTGAFNRVMGTNRIPESDAWRDAHIEELGGPRSYGNYQAGWSWAMNTPLRWTKQYASMLGGIRNGMIMSWPGRVANPGSICSQFGHVVDIAPTVLDAARLPAPEMVYGFRQKPMDGQSLVASLSNCDPAKPRTQYFEIGGKLGLWKDGWFASNDDDRLPWQGVPGNGSDPPTRWSLYNLDEDFSQANDLAARHPEKLGQLIGLWKREAGRNQVYPLDHSFGAGRRVAPVPSASHFDFWGKGVSIPATRGPNFIGRSFTVEAGLDLASDTASGVIIAVGSRFAGWSLYLDRGTPVFHYALTHEEDQVTRIQSSRKLPAGRNTLQLAFELAGIGKSAEITLSSGDRELARGQVPATFFVAGGSGEMLDVGRDTGVPVTDYAAFQGEIEGDVSHVKLDLY